ncbi:MAG: META domain-containing protein [Proteobacteria bacterium]|nr:META domain-containing protein [Pseudomonadota bacterium]
MKSSRTLSLVLSSAALITMAACTTPPSTSAQGAPLEGTHWRLASVDGQAVPMPAGVREVYLMLDGAQHRASGFAGCNQFTSGYVLNGAALRFERAAATMMACPALAQEQAYLNALNATTGWRVSADRLQLLDAQGKAQAEFTARAMK